MKFWQKFKQGLFTKSQVAVGITVTAITTSALVYAFQHILALNTFNTGDVLSASAVNANFLKINEAVSRTSSQFLMTLDASHTPFTSSSPTPLTFTLNTAAGDYDLTAQQYSVPFQASGLLTITESGLYQYHITLAKNPTNPMMNIQVVNNTTPTTLDYFMFSSWDAAKSFTGTHYLNSGAVIEIEGSTPDASVGLDVSKIKFFFKRL